GFPIGSVIGTHYRYSLALFNTLLKSRQICLPQILWANPGIKGMPQRFRPAMYGIVFRRSHRLQIFRIISLDPFYKSHTHTSGQIGVLSIGFLPPSPSGITEYIDVWR